MDRFQVPCCPHCHRPLIRAEVETQGWCPSIHCPAKGEPFSRDTWTWIHQDVFNCSELPPHNGWLGPVVA